MPRFPSAAVGVGVSTGTIAPYGGATAPDGYLLCDGSAVSRTTYADLFAVISTSYGVGDGSTTFNLPDLTGKVPVGIGASGVTNLGDTGGEQEHTLIIAEMPAHTHGISDNAATHGSGTTRAGPDASDIAQSTSKGGDAAHNNMQPYVGTKYIIKA